MRSVVLSGFMGTGKSTVGPALATKLGLPFVDTDAEIERRSGRSVASLWQSEGEPAFRAREAELVEKLLTDGTARVVAFGGGTVTTARTRRLALDSALVVTLTASPDAIVARIPDVRSRPNLAGPDPVARVRELLELRTEAYAECHLTVSTDGAPVEETVRRVEGALRRDALVVPLGSRSYTIDVCTEDPTRLTEAILRCGPSSILWVTDSNVETLRGAALNASLASIGAPVRRIVLSPGERNKTLGSVAAVWDAALAGGVDRDSLVVAAGGGVVGDLAGFAAACLLRGVRFLQVPTTVLSMVDSSVGGKTGFDHATGKNLIGAFHQPSGVVADLSHLSTLDPRERTAGLAEVAKIAMATDRELWSRVERDASGLARGDVAALMGTVRGAIVAKIRVVRDDEREAGVRALLNLGHTVGHALETYGGYARWLHGEAVALGMIAEMRATAALGWTPVALVHEASALLGALGLRTQVDRAEVEAAWPFVAADKKRSGDAIRLPVVTGVGRAQVRRVPLSELRTALLAAG